jgi:hypothetical protein
MLLVVSQNLPGRAPPRCPARADLPRAAVLLGAAGAALVTPVESAWSRYGLAAPADHAGSRPGG